MEAVVGDDGSVLLRGNDWTGSRVSYTWIRPDGSIRGTLVVPVNQFIRAVTLNEIWSIEERTDGDNRLIRQAVGSESFTALLRNLDNAATITPTPGKARGQPRVRPSTAC